MGQILNRKFIFIFLTLPLENNHFLLIFGHGPHAKQNVYKEYLCFIPHSKASSLQFSFDIFDLDVESAGVPSGLQKLMER